MCPCTLAHPCAHACAHPVHAVALGVCRAPWTLLLPHRGDPGARPVPRVTQGGDGQGRLGPSEQRPGSHGECPRADGSSPRGAAPRRPAAPAARPGAGFAASRACGACPGHWGPHIPAPLPAAAPAAGLTSRSCHGARRTSGGRSCRRPPGGEGDGQLRAWGGCLQHLSLPRDLSQNPTHSATLETRRLPHRGRDVKGEAPGDAQRPWRSLQQEVTAGNRRVRSRPQAALGCQPYNHRPRFFIQGWSQ